MLLYMATVSASTPGSSEDPLVSRSFLEGAFSTAVMTEITNTLGGATDTAINRADEIFRDSLGYEFAPRFTRIMLPTGSAIALSAGASFVLLSGSASLMVSRGTVINVSTGREVESEARLTRNQRYFCTEATRAVITASSAAEGYVDGYYFLEGEAAQPRPIPFNDVATSAWYFHAVEFVYRNELFSGTSATAFSPGSSMTRGMFVTVLHRLDGKPATGTGGGFTDVRNPSAYYYDAVTWADANGIVRGYSDGTFRPDRLVTREEMAVFMHRYASFKGRIMTAPGNAYDAFPDMGDVSSFAASAMRWAVSWEVISGSGGRLLPQSSATRAQVAQIILNYCEKIGR